METCTIHSSRLTVTASCPMDLQFFPMDRQICALDIESCEYSYLSLSLITYSSTKAIAKVPINNPVPKKKRNLCFPLISIMIFPENSGSRRVTTEESGAVSNPFVWLTILEILSHSTPRLSLSPSLIVINTTSAHTSLLTLSRHGNTPSAFTLYTSDNHYLLRPTPRCHDYSEREGLHTTKFRAVICDLQ